ncbi:HAMP domain-containing sensor histidine kinase [Neobacillus sp. SM06]|uniref:HAMP domain-containing sensor histidine kinase n=1 Tax=Neobacillus sp. SM06 TaxID=3422492 RepID=UPI003D270EC6
MKNHLSNRSQAMRWQTKLILSSSTAIFLTFFLFSFLEYNSVSKLMMKREEQVVNRTMTDIATYYKDREDKLTATEIVKSEDFLRKMNDKDQLIRIYDQKGTVIVSDKNGHFSVLEPEPVTKSSLEKISTGEYEAIVEKKPLKTVHFQGTIEIVRELNSYQKMMDHLFWIMSIFGLAAILLSAISGFFLAKQLLKPVRELAKAMKKIKENGFQERMVVYKQKDELTDLSNLFNEMMDELEAAFTQQKQFIEDASHELRTPVSILEGHLSLLNRWGKKDPAILDESLEASLQEVARLKKLVVDLLDLTRAENARSSLSQEMVDVKSILEQLVKNLDILHPDFQFVLQFSDQLKPIWMSEQYFQQILIILLDNAINYSEDKKKIVIQANQTEKGTVISVQDQGIGIPSEHLSNVFNRFYRIDKARSRGKGGTGLGLAIAKQLIDKANGSIKIESEEGRGTKVTLFFPYIG